ncbi:MAG: phospholipase C, partial [Mycobacteriales bacterium]
MGRPGLTLRQILAGGAGAGVALGLAGGPLRRLDRAAAAVPTRCAPLSDIEHVVILIQENRAFDHYFGSYRAVRGFADPHALRQPGGLPILYQPGYQPGVGADPTGHLLPFHLDTATSNAECTNDISHDRGPQHLSWNQGRMDRWVVSHLQTEGPANAPLTMGYYTRTDLAFYYALADAFTICDRYHCSVIGPTHPNRLYTVSGTLDPDGDNGGPLVETVGPPGEYSYDGKFTWRTMPEQLQAAGVSWKIYQSPDTVGSTSAVLGNNVLRFFSAYTDPATPLSENAFLP